MGGARGGKGSMQLQWLQPWQHDRGAMVGGVHCCKAILSQGWWDDDAIFV